RHDGSRRAWSAALLPLLAVPRAAGAAALLGGIVMTTKAAAAAGACAAVAFLAGWTLKPEDPGRSRVPARDAERAVTLETENEALGRKLSALESENAELRARAAKAPGTPAAPPVPPAAPADSLRRPRFVYTGAEKALDAIDWSVTGEAIAKITPLLHEMAASIAEGRPLPPSVGEIQRWNGPLVTQALTLSNSGVEGTGVNGAFTHPSVLVNSIHATLLKAGRPLDPAQEEALGAVGLRFLEEDRDRLAAYGDATFALKKLIDETTLKDRFFVEVDALLREEQREALHPASMRGRLQTDLFSSGIVWLQFAGPTPAPDRATFAARCASKLAEHLELDVAARNALEPVAAAWAGAFPDAYWNVAGDPLSLSGMMTVERVEAAARQTLALFESLPSRLALTSGQAEALRDLLRVPVPYLERK
ncbi:MAG: hypothetical protein ACREID_03865, partial [Planctomycetota bacterium]